MAELGEVAGEYPSHVSSADDSELVIGHDFSPLLSLQEFDMARKPEGRVLFLDFSLHHQFTAPTKLINPKHRLILPPASRKALYLCYPP